MSQPPVHRRSVEGETGLNARGEAASDTVADMSRLQEPAGRIVLETDRSTLRELTLEDLQALSRLYADPDVRRFFPEGTLTLDETREELEWIIDVYYRRYGYGLWGTFERSSGELIGRCGLLPWKVVSSSPNLALTEPDEDPSDEDRYEVEIAYLLAKDRWGLGLATEATRAIVDLSFETLDVARLICLVDPENRASIGVARLAGFAVDGHVSIDDDEPFPLLSLPRERWANRTDV
jgi:ribosomal-protein-alanine N-acetyltransferase